MTELYWRYSYWILKDAQINCKQIWRWDEQKDNLLENQVSFHTDLSYVGKPTLLRCDTKSLNM